MIEDVNEIIEEDADSQISMYTRLISIK